MIDADAAMDFLTFVGARHEAYTARQAGREAPWTAEPIVASHKFTNVFRVLDYGSQFVLTDLVGPGAGDYLMRCFLYRHTNLPSAWLAFARETGSMPFIEQLDQLREFWQDYRASGGQVFSGAYMIYPQSSTPGTDKVDSVIDLTKRLFQRERIYNEFMTAPNQREKFAVLRRNKGVADFMSMQILTDWGYSTEFREDQFVVPGPGARKGAAALGLSGEDAVKWAVSAIRAMPHRPMLGGRPPSYMDAQNCLCEFSKWVRYAAKPLPAKPYQPTHPGPQPAPVLPKHW